MKIKTSELEDVALDWAVATLLKQERHISDVEIEDGKVWILDGMWQEGHLSWSWELCGPIIEREKITVRFWEGESFVHAYKWDTEGWHEGPTPLIAAMRCYVASKLGDEIEIPEELA